MPLFLVALAVAAPHIVSVGSPLRADASGNWPRMFPQEDGGWTLLTANQSGVTRTELDASFAVRSAGRPLVADESLLDHGYAICPDETILHVAMGTRTSAHHTAVVRRYAPDWTLLSTTMMIDDDPRAIIIDQGVVCGPNPMGTANGPVLLFLFRAADVGRNGIF